MSSPVLAALNITATAAQLPSAATAASSSQSVGGTHSSSAYDLERLRSLVAAPETNSGVQQIGGSAPVGQTQQVHSRTMGDSILEGLSRINSGYNNSLDSINNRLNTISTTDASSLGNNFGEMMALQMEVARWSLSVTGVDNSAKAATNTVKELSKGG